MNKSNIVLSTSGECVQCGRRMVNAYAYEEDKWQAPFCDYADCPNYGLLQTGMLVSVKDLK